MEWKYICVLFSLFNRKTILWITYFSFQRTNLRIPDRLLEIKYFSCIFLLYYDRWAICCLPSTSTPFWGPILEIQANTRFSKRHSRSSRLIERPWTLIQQYVYSSDCCSVSFTLFRFLLQRREEDWSCNAYYFLALSEDQFKCINLLFKWFISHLSFFLNFSFMSVRLFISVCFMIYHTVSNSISVF